MQFIKGTLGISKYDEAKGVFVTPGLQATKIFLVQISVFFIKPDFSRVILYQFFAGERKNKK